MSSMPVKQLSLYYSNNGVVFLKGSRLHVQEAEQLRKLRWANRTKKF